MCTGAQPAGTHLAVRRVRTACAASREYKHMPVTQGKEAGEVHRLDAEHKTPWQDPRGAPTIKTCAAGKPFTWKSSVTLQWKDQCGRWCVVVPFGFLPEKGLLNGPNSRMSHDSKSALRRGFPPLLGPRPPTRTCPQEVPVSRIPSLTAQVMSPGLGDPAAAVPNVWHPTQPWEQQLHLRASQRRVPSHASLLTAQSVVTLTTGP